MLLKTKNLIKMGTAMSLFLSSCTNEIGRVNRMKDDIEYIPSNASTSSQSIINYSSGETVKLISGIKNELMGGTVDDFIENSLKHIKVNHNFFNEKKSTLLWLRYFNAFEYCRASNIKNSTLLQERVAREIIDELLLHGVVNNIYKQDYRVLRKILALNILPNGVDKEKVERLLIDAFKDEIRQALNYLIWKEQNKNSTIFTKELLHQLLICCDERREEILNALIIGRFDKNDFNFFSKSSRFHECINSIILGEDGGLYVLINSINQETKSILNELVDDNYLVDKRFGNDKNKIIIGAGAFGKVRFAISLFVAKAKPGDVICVKKTSSYEDINPTRIILDSFNNYIVDNSTKVVAPPVILDIATILNTSLEDQEKEKHMKGYVFMEIFPQNTGDKIFSQEKYQEWEYQKPYVRGVFSAILELLDQGVVMTDLKPANTLFDVDNRTVKIIDTGGIIKPHDITCFGPQQVEHTPYFAAPELALATSQINLRQALSYGCGKVLDATISLGTKHVDIAPLKELVASMTQENPNERLSIQDALVKLKNIKTTDGDKWEESVVFQAYINKIKDRLKNNRSSIGINQDIYDIKEKLYIPVRVTRMDPQRYKNLPTLDLLDEMKDNFLNKEYIEENKQVMLILGNAGSGKSIVMQQKFIDAVDAWESGSALPIYFNMANNINMKDVLRTLDNELNTGIMDNMKDKAVLLFADSFDEGLYPENGDPEREKDKVIKSYINHPLFGGMQGKNVRLAVSCRTDYLKNDENERWFFPERGPLGLAKWYITSIFYEGENAMTTAIEKWCNYNNEKSLSIIEQKNKALEIIGLDNLLDENDFKRHREQKYQAEYFAKLINKSGLKSDLTTGYLLYMALDVFSDKRTYKRLKDIYRIELKDLASRHNLYREYVTNYMDSAIEKLNLREIIELSREFQNLRYLKSSEELLQANLSLRNLISDINPRSEVGERLREIALSFKENPKFYVADSFENTVEELAIDLRELGKWISTILHLEAQFRIKNDSVLFKAYDYNESTLIKYQKVYFLLSLLPSKIELTQVGGQYELSQEVAMAFIHDSVKNYYLLEAIKDELKESEKEGEEMREE
jgi:serine/threonine protein kinase